MDADVLAAMAKWPDVPDVYGWLRLDRRGRWLIRDEAVGNLALATFIGRNYAHDRRGAWFFQNGPQRVFVKLDYTPWVFRSNGECIETHTGLAIRAPRAAWTDAEGNLLVSTEHGMGLVHDQDLPALLDGICDQQGQPANEAQLLALMNGSSGPLQLRLWQARLPLLPIPADQVAAIGGFMRDPQPVSDATR